MPFKYLTLSTIFDYLIIRFRKNVYQYVIKKKLLYYIKKNKIKT